MKEHDAHVKFLSDRLSEMDSKLDALYVEKSNLDLQSEARLKLSLREDELKVKQADLDSMYQISDRSDPEAYLTGNRSSTILSEAIGK